MLEVCCDAQADLSAEAQLPVLEAFMSLPQRFAVVFDVRAVKLNATVLNLWLEQLDQLGANFHTVGIVSNHACDEVLAGAFGLAAQLRRHPLRIEVFTEVDAARKWAADHAHQQPKARRSRQAATGNVTAFSRTLTSAAD